MGYQYVKGTSQNGVARSPVCTLVCTCEGIVPSGLVCGRDVGLDRLSCGLMQLYLEPLLGVFHLGLNHRWQTRGPRNCPLCLSIKNVTLLPEQQSTRPQVNKGWLLIVSPRTVLEKR